MDKYEYHLKADQIEKLVKKKDYEAAAKIADTIDWRRVKNLNMLYVVSEVYEKTERYGECMEILDMAYDRAPVGRMLLYRMTEICTKMHNFDEAISLYREFVKAAPHDQSRFILKYQIYRERGSSLEDQIRILSEYKTHEYQEKWAYELAALYDEAGMPEECVHECDELILWFSEGEYVNKALELKMKYVPLTAAQQEKYNYQRIGSGSAVRGNARQEPEVPGFDPGKFSTMNLQAELAGNLNELFKEDATIDLPDLGLGAEEGAVREEENLREDATIDLPDLGLEEGEETVQEARDLREDATIDLPDLGLGAEEEAVQEARDLREDATIDLPDLGLGTEEEAVQEARDLREDATIDLPDLGLGAEEEAVQETSDLREDATIDLPVLGLGAEEEAVQEAKNLREDATIDLPDLGLGAEEEAVQEAKNLREDATIDLPDLGLGAEEEAVQEASDLREDATIDLPDLGTEEDTAAGESAAASGEEQNTGPISIDEILDEWAQTKAQAEARLKAEALKEKARREKVKQETAELMKLIAGPSEDIPEDVQQILEELNKEKKEETPVVTEDDLPPDLDAEEEPETEMAIESLDDRENIRRNAAAREEAQDAASGNMIQELKRSLTSKVSEGAVNAGHLTREQARLFAYFTSVQGMSEQLSVLFKETGREGRSTSSGGNLTITGEQGNGKTTLAIDIVKALQKQNRLEGKKLAKISGKRLNTKDIYEVITKLKGGALIVEKAGGLSDATMMAMGLAMETDTGGLLVILEDSAEEIQRLFLRNKNFASKFDHHIDIPVFTNDELVAFGKSYALEQEYSFDEFGILALYDRIGSRQTNDHLVTVAEVKDMIDAAIENAERGSFRHLLDRVTKKSVDEFGNHLIREADFTE